MRYVNGRCVICFHGASNLAMLGITITMVSSRERRLTRGDCALLLSAALPGREAQAAAARLGPAPAAAAHLRWPELLSSCHRDTSHRGAGQRSPRVVLANSIPLCVLYELCDHAAMFCYAY